MLECIFKLNLIYILQTDSTFFFFRLCHTIGSHRLSVLYTVVCIFQSQPPSLSISLFPLGVHTFVLCVSISALQIGSSVLLKSNFLINEMRRCTLHFFLCYNYHPVSPIKPCWSLRSPTRTWNYIILLPPHRHCSPDLCNSFFPLFLIVLSPLYVPLGAIV